MIPDMFGKPEAYGVVLGEEDQPGPRRVHVTGRVTIEINVDEWIDAEPDETDAEIKQAAIDAAREGFSDQWVSSDLDIHDEARTRQQAQHRLETDLLAAWNRGEPIIATPPRAR